ncbi:MAG: hypothetical protein OER96_08095 [Gammaproteobacteria bacterium]|nr:hypothetical protein [Gammaproteobacteria bacterium]
MRNLNHFIIYCGTILFAGNATAGTIVEFEVQDGGQTQVQSAHIQNGFVSIKNPGGAKNIDALFQREHDRAFIIEHDKKSYLIINEAKVEEFTAQARGMMALVQAQMEGMTDEQRAEMEKSMENMGMGGLMNSNEAAPIPEYKQTSEQRDVNGYLCQVVQVFKNQKLDSEMCVASRASLSMTDADYDTLKAMHNFAQRMASKAAMFMNSFGGTLPELATGEIEGLPVAVNDIDDKVTVTLRSINTADIDPSRLGVPKGYTESALPTIGQ